MTLGRVPSLNISALPSGTIETVVSSLVRVIPSCKDQDAVTSNFLSYYKRFCTTEKLIQLLNDNCSLESKRLPQFIKLWIQSYYAGDFCVAKDGKLKTRPHLQELLTLLQRMLEMGMSDANSVKLIILKHHALHSISGKLTPQPAAKKVKMGFGLLRVQELAIQLTLLEYKLFQNIDRTEFYNKGWMRDSKLTTSPNITAMIQRSNHMSLWVATMIINQQEQRKRIKIAQKMLCIAQWCKELGNLNSVMEILCGMNMWVVRRLIKSSQLKEKYSTIWTYLHNIIDPSHNYKSYRAVLTKRSPTVPTLPYLGVFLRDYTFIEDGNEDYVPDSQDRINFDKISLIGDLLARFRQYQCVPYEISSSMSSPTSSPSALGSTRYSSDPDIAEYLMNIKFYNEAKLEEMSMRIRPSTIRSDDDEDGGSKSSTESTWKDLEDSEERSSIFDESYEELSESGSVEENN
eukprot:TRINITY_DN13252_c0_g1_i1.p1 TRINITY_DN13252_c0_g1~~TRINITY_DN13252_c0_g1_i1.p1  ORF type:complete len:460 (-),score=94.87 TRINITY_DN13252_c0_g1_i1:124-1503(-)